MTTDQADSIPPRVLTKTCPTCNAGYAGDVSVCPADGTMLTTIANDILIGTTIAGRYQILSFIGRGGMSVVYKARHKYMERIAAIKMLHAHLVSNDKSLKRFQQEAQAASCLAHPNIMGVHDFGLTAQGQPYLVMDYLQGASLAEVIEKDGPLTAERAINLFIQACDALAHAHQKNVVHRDLKPSNIMLVEDADNPDFVKIVDFGIAKILPQAERQGQHLTQTGEVFGSPLYMSPEQCLSSDLDARSDVYSLGCVMYETLTGKVPLSGANMLETMYMHLNEPPLPFRKVRPDLSIPEDLEAIIFKTMEKLPKDRQQSMLELKEDLESMRAAPKGKRPFLSKLSGAPARRRKGPQIKLSRQQIGFLAAGAVLAGSTLTWVLLGSGQAPEGSSAYGQDSYWVSYSEAQAEPLNQVQASQLELMLKGVKMFKERMYGGLDPRVVDVYLRLAKFYRRQNRNAEALEYYRKAYDSLRAEVTSEKFHLNDVAKELVEVYCLMENYSEAESVAEDSLKRYRADSQEPEYPVFKMALADCYYHEGKVDEAIPLIKQAIDLWTNTAIADRPSAALAYIDLSELYRTKRDYKQAAEAFKAGEQFKEDEIGPNNIALPRYLLCLSWLYEKAGDYAEAEPLYKKAWSISEKARGPKNQEIAIILNRYSELLWKTNLWLEAFIYKVRSQMMKG